MAMRAVIVVLIAIGLGLNGCGAHAQDASRRALAEELLNEMDMKGTVEKSFAMIKKIMPAHMKAMRPAKEKADISSTPSDATQQTATAMDKMMDTMAQELSWEKMKEDYITIYAETFTEDELKGAVAFYKSPAGKAFSQKQPEVMRRSMELSQRMMLKFMPKIQTMTKDTIDAQMKGLKRAPPPAPIKEPPPVIESQAVPAKEPQKNSK
jgi:uncharacterized protein